VEAEFSRHNPQGRSFCPALWHVSDACYVLQQNKLLLSSKSSAAMATLAPVAVRTQQSEAIMATDEAGTGELGSRKDGRVIHIRDRWDRKGSTEVELIREDERLNRQTIGRIAEVEAQRSLPILEQAAVDAERGQRLRSMAAFAEDPELELELGAVLRRLATAAEPPRWTNRRSA
jgi:hypothetical protein